MEPMDRKDAPRKALWNEISNYILPADKAQCWLAGDFNFTECDADRCNVLGLKPSEADREELAAFSNLKQAHELF